MQGPSGGPFPDYPEPVECGEVMFSPLGKPPPEGWQIAGALERHHGHFSYLAHREPGEAMKAGDIARKAAELVGGDRQDAYGHVSENFARIATLWNAWLEIRRDPVAPLTAEDVGQMLSMMKKARTQSGPYSADSHVDDCGYAALAGEVAATRSSR